jgi:tryptophan-rich sensory protein
MLGPLAMSAVVAVGVALLGGALTETGPWYRALQKPSWQPPNWLFAPAWALIFALTTVGAAIAWRDAPDRGARTRIAGLFGLNAVLNVLWSFLFFTMQRPDWALIEVCALWLSIMVLIVALSGWSEMAAFLLAPYLAWVTFAAYLNLTIVWLN